MNSANTNFSSTDFAGNVASAGTREIKRTNSGGGGRSRFIIQGSSPTNNSMDSNNSNHNGINEEEFRRLLNTRDSRMKEEIDRQQEEIKTLREELSFLISRSSDINGDKNPKPSAEEGAPRRGVLKAPSISSIPPSPPLSRSSSVKFNSDPEVFPNKFGVVYGDDGETSKTEEEEDDDDEDEGIDLPLLPEDTFSYLAFSKWNSTSMITALVVVVIQIVTLSVLAMDFASTTIPGNSMAVPVNVNNITAIIQVVALFIIVFSQGDLQDSLNLLFMGYDKQELEKNLHTTISYPRWLISLSTRLFVTSFGLAITFVMIVRESDVTQLLLDFTSIEFVTNIDNIFFWLTAWGYLGLSAQKDASTIVAAKAPVLVQEEIDDNPFSPEARVHSNNSFDNNNNNGSNGSNNSNRRNALQRIQSNRRRTHRKLHVRKKSKENLHSNPHAHLEGQYEFQEPPESVHGDDMENHSLAFSSVAGSGPPMLIAQYQKELLKFGEEYGNRFCARFPRFLFICTIYFFMVVGWLVIFIGQRSGSFVCHTVFVQFNDIYHPGLATFSGLYDSRCMTEGGRNYCERATYVESGHGNYSGTAEFFFCEDISAWVFGFEENGQVDCKNWITRSSEQNTMEVVSYNILESTKGSEPWTIQMGDRRELPMPTFTMQCYDCKYDEDFCGGEGRGRCVNNRCVCEEGWYGYRCDYKLPCQKLEVNPLHNVGGSRTWAGTYRQILAPPSDDDDKTSEESQELLTKYNRPTYIGGGQVEGRGAVPVEVIFYNGRRWVNMVLDASVTYEQVQKFLIGAHGYWSNYTSSFVTIAVDVNTPQDSADPSQLDWLEANPPDSATDRGRVQGPNVQNNRIDLRLLCSSCNNETNTCFYDGFCNAEAECVCKQGDSKKAGKLCQVPPTGDGFCDVTFNTPQFNFDGGDCCENTCVSSAENECGVVEQSTSTGKTMVFIGFPNCTDPDAVKQIGGSQTLYNVLERGQVICGTYQSDFMTDFFEAQCQTLAAAVLGDKDAYIVDLWGSAVGINRFIALNEGKYDIVFGSDFLANRDIYERKSESPFSYAVMPYYSTGLSFAGIPQFVECADNYDYISSACQGIKICVSASSSWYDLVRDIFPLEKIIGTEGFDGSIPALRDGLCNVFGATGAELAQENVERLGYNMSLGYAVGDRIHSKSFETWMTRSADRLWTKMTSWVFEALVQAEESGISQLDAGLMKATPVFNDATYVFDDLFQRAVAANGNFGEIWENRMPFPRPVMNHVCNGTSGLIYSMDFGAFKDLGDRPSPGGHIERILKRGALVCAVSQVKGFAEFNDQTNSWVGFEVDICRAVAAAIFNGPPKVDFVTRSTSELFSGVKSGSIDISTGRTRTLEREIKHGSTGGFAFDFSPPYFFDGMIFGGYEPHGQCAANLDFDGACADTLICVTAGTTWQDAVIAMEIPNENIKLTTSSADALEKHLARECNAIAIESNRLDPTLKATEGYFVGTEFHTKDPLSLMHRSDDQQFSDLIRWIIYGLFYAEENGVTKETSIDMPTTNLFGSELTGIWQNSIRESGNYGEIFSRNLDGLVVREGLNLLNRLDGPQLCASPGTAPLR